MDRGAHRALLVVVVEVEEPLAFDDRDGENQQSPINKQTPKKKKKERALVFIQRIFFFLFFLLLQDSQVVPAQLAWRIDQVVRDHKQAHDTLAQDDQRKQSEPFGQMAAYKRDGGIIGQGNVGDHLDGNSTEPDAVARAVRQKLDDEGAGPPHHKGHKVGCHVEHDRPPRGIIRRVNPDDKVLAN